MLRIGPSGAMPLPRTPSSLHGFGFIAHGTHFNDITEASWSAANLRYHVAEPWSYRHTDNELQQRKPMALVSLSWQEHLDQGFLGLRHELQFPENPNTPRETVTVKVQLINFSNCLLQNVERNLHLWGLHTKVTFQGDCVSCSWDRKLLFWTIICTTLSPRKRHCLIGWHHLEQWSCLHQSCPLGVFPWMFFTYIFHGNQKTFTWIIYIYINAS